MKILFNFFIKNFKVSMYYRLSFFGMIFILSLVYSTRLFFLDSLFQYTDSFTGWSKHQIIFLLYFLMTSLLFTDSFDSSIIKFFQKVYHGESEPLLVKPVGILYYLFFGWFKFSSFIIALIMLFFGTFFYREILFQHGILVYLLFLVLMTIGIVTNLLLIANLSSLTFVIKRMVPADFIFSEISKVMSMPFSIYSRKVGISLSLFIPSLFCAAIPSAVVVQGDYSLVIFLIAGFVFTLLTFIFLFNYTFSKFEGVGG